MSWTRLPSLSLANAAAAAAALDKEVSPDGQGGAASSSSSIVALRNKAGQEIHGYSSIVLYYSSMHACSSIMGWEAAIAYNRAYSL